MRKITVKGNCESARVLREYLKKAGVTVSAASVIHLEEHTGDHIICDSVDSELEAHVLRCISELTPKDIILRRRGGQVQSEREIRLLIPSGDAESAHAVEVGVLRGVQRRRNWLQRVFHITAVLCITAMLFPSSVKAGPHSISSTSEDGSVLHLNLPTDLFPQLQVPAGFTFTGGSLNVNCTGGCAGGGGSSITSWGGGTLGAMANYGTSPGAVLVPGVNAFITNTPAVTLASTTVTNTVAVSGTVTTAPPADASTNVTKFGGTAVSTGTGVGGAGIPRVTVSSDSFPATQAVSGTVTTTPPANASSNVTQFGGTNISTGTGTGGAGIPRVTVSSDSFPATQAVSGSVSVSNFPATQPVSGTVSVTNFANPLPVTGTFFQATQPVSGTVTTVPANPAQAQSVQVANTPFKPVPVSVLTPMFVAVLSNGQIIPVQLVEGQATMGNSLPVTLASDQSPIKVTVASVTSVAGLGADQQSHSLATDGAGNQFFVPLGLPRQPCNPVRKINCQP